MLSTIERVGIRGLEEQTETPRKGNIGDKGREFITNQLNVKGKLIEMQLRREGRLTKQESHLERVSQEISEQHPSLMEEVAMAIAELEEKKQRILKAIVTSTSQGENPPEQIMMTFLKTNQLLGEFRQELISNQRALVCIS